MIFWDFLRILDMDGSVPIMLSCAARGKEPVRTSLPDLWELATHEDFKPILRSKLASVTVNVGKEPAVVADLSDAYGWPYSELKLWQVAPLFGIQRPDSTATENSPGKGLFAGIPTSAGGENVRPMGEFPGLAAFLRKNPYRARPVEKITIAQGKVTFSLGEPMGRSDKYFRVPGKKLSAAMKAAGVNKHDLADILEVAFSGARNLPDKEMNTFSEDKMRRLTAALEVSEEALIDRTATRIVQEEAERGRKRKY